MTTSIQTSRRSFLKTSTIGGSGLLMGFALPFSVAKAAGTVHTPNAWVHISDSNVITLISARSEMGQGVYTALPMLIAEELNVDFRKIQVAIAPPNAKVYGNPLLGGPQLTGGSTSVRDAWEKLRVGGAQVREMLISAAAEKWKVDRSELKAVNGTVVGPNGKKATYGQLAAAASKLPVLQQPRLGGGERQPRTRARHAGGGQVTLSHLRGAPRPARRAPEGARTCFTEETWRSAFCR